MADIHNRAARRKFNKAKHQLKRDYPDRHIRASEALEILVDKYLDQVE